MALACQFAPITAHLQFPGQAKAAENVSHPMGKTKGLQISSTRFPTFNKSPNFLPRTRPWIAEGIKIYTKAGFSVISSKTSIDTTQELLEAYDDEYGGVIIDADRLPSGPNTFTALLQSSLSHWRLKGKKGVWLKLFTEQADLVPFALKEGFRYHHAEPGYVMLTYWLPKEACSLPATGSHQVGMGGFVINENKEVLVVKEKRCPTRCSGVWKLPTGFIDKSEEIFLGAIREIKEETGIDTEFLEVVAFRHAHNVTFEKSDLFFICMLKPLSFNIKIDESEIEDAKWMPLNEFISQSFYQEDFMSKKAIDICISRYNGGYKGFTAHQVISKFDERLSYLYYKD